MRYLLRKSYLLVVCAGVVLPVQVCAEPIVLKLGPELAHRIGKKALEVTLAPGASTLQGPEGPGVEPLAPGPAFRVPLPAGIYSSGQGTLMFRLRSSRRIGFVPRTIKPRFVNIISSPAIGLELSESYDSPRFRIFSPDRAKSRGPVIRIAYLDPGKWYYMAVAWQAETGTISLYVNGCAQQRVQLPPWKPVQAAKAVLELGGTLGQGEQQAKFAVSSPEWFAWYMTEAQVRRILLGHEMCQVGAAVRQSYERPIDLSGYKLEPIFEPDFSKPIPFISEDELFEGGRRVRQPRATQWVLEGKAKVFTREGHLTIDNLLTDGVNHVVLWLPKVFPENFLLEFDITIEREDEGLAIVFFAARPRDDPAGSIFKAGLGRRDGVFKRYILGDVNSYHVSYLAASGSSSMGGPRLSANCRKNSGFWLVACGDDQIQGHGIGRGPHHVRFLKFGNRIRVEANHRLSLSFDDDGKTWGKVLTDGYIGLRQMNHLLSAEYSHLKVSSVEKK